MSPAIVSLITGSRDPVAGEPLPIADAAERERALEAASSFIVQAPAGSGKTELLTQRVLRLLATVDDPEEIVALTFTRKAAREMRERIVGALRMAVGPEPDEPHRRTTWGLAARALKRDAERGWNLMTYPGRLRVTTIDSLCSSIARQMPVVSRFGAVPDVADDPDALYRDAARELLASLDTDREWVPALERLLLRLDNDHARVEGPIITMLGKRDQWLRHVVRVGATDRAGTSDRNGASDRVDASATRAELERGLAHAITDALRAARACMSDVVAAEIAALASYAGATLRAAATESPICACCGIGELPCDDPDALEIWLGVATMLLTGSGTWRAKVSKSTGFPAKDPMKPRMEELLGALAADGSSEELRAALCALRSLPPAAYSEEQWEAILALVEVLKASAGFLETTFQLHGRTDFAGIAIAARTALGTDENPTDLALSLDYQIRHLLVDEFQDTSHGQFELLERLTAGWEPGDGRTIFAVGDPMQSIYRFREAEVGLFLQARTGGIGSIPLTPLTLSVNFRSQAGIVEWVNEAFAAIFPPADDIGSGAVTYTASAPRHARLDGAAVVVEPQIGRDFEEEATRLAAIIERERAADPEATIAILVRGRPHLARIVERLRRDGVRFQAVEIDRLRDRAVVSDLLSLTRAILHPADRIAWLASLRAPWCGLELADLAALTDGAVDRTIWDLLRDETRTAAMSAAGRARAGRFVGVLVPVMEQLRRRTLRRTVEGAWLALGGPACVGSREELRDAGRYFELLDLHEEGGDVLDVAALEKDVDDLYAAPEMSERRLQIMTVHKAKGLEFDVVIVPGLGRGTPPETTELLLFTERPHAHEVDLLIAPIKASDDDADPVYRYLRELERTKREQEDRRLLYVAATRAKRRLYLLGHAEITTELKPANGSLLAYLWPAAGPVFHELLNRMIAEDIGESVEAPSPSPTARPITRLVDTWRSPQPPEDAVWQRAGREIEMLDTDTDLLSMTWAEATTRHIGTAVHRMLCRVARDGAERWSAERVAERRASIAMLLAGLGVGDDQLDRATRIVCDAVTATLGDERGRWILSSSHTAIDNELPLTGLVGDALRSVKIDRTFVDAAGTRWIIDYKAGYHESVADRETYLDMEQRRYREQLELYTRLIEAIDPGRPVRRGLYFPRLGGWREW
ncbi:MAG TPA: UvrD-helicase domain-containing protein [Candidatus Kapabacteria bacterium]|nr:UvrD-helicase domain-containing protein [Candidatus Kapabacteria bacterium]